MNYKRKRQKAGITFATMVKELGIPENKYKEVEENKRNLEGNMLDKFMEVLNRAKEVQINDMQKIKEIDEWIKNGGVQEAIKKYGFTSQNELARELNVSQGRLSEMINGKDNISDNFKLKVYNFLTNPLNKKAREEEEVKAKSGRRPDYINWTIKNLEKEIKKAGIKQTDLAKHLSCTNTHISHIVRGDTKPSKKIAKQIYDYFNKGVEEKVEEVKKENIGTIVVKTQDKDIIVKPVEKTSEKEAEKVVSDYKDLSPLEKKLAQKDVEIIKLKRQIMLYEKLIARL